MSLRENRLLLLLSGVAFVILVCLGTWQVKRLQWKTALIAQVETLAKSPPVSLSEALQRYAQGEDIEYLPVRVTGGFPNARTAHVFGTYDGKPGYYAFQAMQPEAGEGRYLLINRGFVEQDSRQEFYPLPNVDALTGLVRFYDGRSGLALGFTPVGEPEEGIFYQRDLSELAGFVLPGNEDAFLPFALDSTLPTRLPRGDTTKLDFRNAHLGYALTWYGLAIALLFVLFSLVRKRG